MAGNVYLLQEDKAILRYIIEGHYESVIKGNNIWKQMADDPVLAHRTWQSLRNRFFKTISVDLSRPEYGLTADERIGLRVYLRKPLTKLAAEIPKKHNRFMPVSGESKPAAAGEKRTLALYTLEEDKAILKYILGDKLEYFIKGNDLWIRMEDEKVCPTRSWQSLKNRFIRYILPAYTKPEYELSDAEQERLRQFHLQPQPSTIERTAAEATGEDVGSPVQINSDTSEYEAPTRGSTLGGKTKPASNRTVTASTCSANDKDFFSLDMDSDSDD
ncbi:hypothetical protein HUJ05_004148 [Dendroctonus ponderosae]|nr:hypothetical protein HUJ05_004148 [Dendroctonus ponderosae]